MVVTELRIGNLVTLSEKVRQEMWDNQISAYNEYFKVDVIYSDGDVVLELDDENVDFESKNIEPIELTEEWLEKFGLKNSETGYEVIVKQTKFSAIKAKGFFSVGLAGPFGLYLIKLKYVHQFQNLYYSVFLEELTIKEQL